MMKQKGQKVDSEWIECGLGVASRRIQSGLCDAR